MKLNVLRLRRTMGAVLLLSSVMGLSGCSLLNPGEENFSCSGMPDGAHCNSTRSTYEATAGGNVPTPMHPDSEDQRQEQITKNKDTLTVTEDELINNYVTPALADKPIPIRTPSQVMRIWVAPYVDKNGDLQAPGFVYTEIEPRRWIYSSTEQGTNAHVFTPLENTKDYFSSTQTPQQTEDSLKTYRKKQNAK